MDDPLFSSRMRTGMEEARFEQAAAHHPEPPLVLGGRSRTEEPAAIIQVGNTRQQLGSVCLIMCERFMRGRKRRCAACGLACFHKLFFFRVLLTQCQDMCVSCCELSLLVLELQDQKRAVAADAAPRDEGKECGGVFGNKGNRSAKGSQGNAGNRHATGVPGNKGNLRGRGTRGNHGNMVCGASKSDAGKRSAELRRDRKVSLLERVSPA